MALTEDLEKLLAQIPDEADRTASKNLLEKYEPLRAGFLRQSDYDRNMNAWKTEKAKLDQEIADAIKTADEWIGWGKTNKPRHEQLLTEYEAKTKRVVELEQQVSEALAKATLNLEDGEMDTAQLLKNVQDEMSKRGYMTKAEIDALITTQVSTQVAAKAQEEAQKLLVAEREIFYKETFPKATRFQAAVTKAQLQYARETNQDLPLEDFFKFSQENKIDDVDKAYEQFMAPKKMQKEIERQVEERLNQERAKLGVPGTSAPASPELGPLQMFRMKKTGIEVPEDAEPGDGRLGLAAAAELRASGKF